MSKSQNKKRTNRLGNGSMILFVSAVIVCIAIVVGVSVHGLKEKDRTYQEKEISLQQQIEREEQRGIELEEKRKQSKTLEYYTKIAREKLGMVFPDEIVLRPNE